MLILVDVLLLLIFTIGSPPWNPFLPFVEIPNAFSPTATVLTDTALLASIFVLYLSHI